MSTDHADEFTASRNARRDETTRLFDLVATASSEIEREDFLNQVIVRNMEVAKSICSRFRNRGIALEDLEQVAYMALVRSAHKFDPAMGHDFLEYAVPSIKGEVRKHFRDHGWTIRPPRRLQQAQAMMGTAFNGGEIDSSMSPTQVAERLGMPVGDVEEALSAQGCFQPVSIDAMHDDRRSIADMIKERCADLDSVDDRVLVATLTQKLSERDRLILFLRFFEDLTQQEIGEQLSISQMQVSRILKRLLLNLREELEPTAEQPELQPGATTAA